MRTPIVRMLIIMDMMAQVRTQEQGVQGRGYWVALGGWVVYITPKLRWVGQQFQNVEVSSGSRAEPASLSGT